jgi:transmembrane sensor
MSGYWPFRWLRKSAAQWFVRLRTEPVTPRLDASFRRWLASDPANEVDYERQELAWELAGELGRDEEIEELVAEAQRATQEPRPAARHILTWSAAAAVLVAAVCIGVYWQWPSSAAVYMTAVGEQRTVVLPDQSRMTLNTSTRVRVEFDREVRVIDLEYGEATFSVTHDAERPFEVRAAQGTARALGTEFNVLSSESDVTVSVLSGKVEVIAPRRANRGERPQSAVLTHGEEITYNGAGVSQIQPADAARINAWRSGRIAFDDVDLQEALREFNRYGRTPIVLGDASLASVRVSGVFRIGETDALLSALNHAFEIQAERRKDAIELHAHKELQHRELQ